MNYNWQHKEWPNFSYSLSETEDKLYLFAEKTGHITGNETAPGGEKEIKKAPVRSAIAHVYFEYIHPFEDAAN